MGFGTWNDRSLCRAISLKTVASKLANYKLDRSNGNNRSHGTRVEVIQQAIVNFSVEIGMLIIT
jgi:hypothetical protein